MIKTLALLLLTSVYPGDLYAPPPIPIAPIVQRPKKIKRLPEDRLIKFLNEDIWAIKAYLKQCYEHDNAKVCATADPDLKQAVRIPPITIVFKVNF